MAVSRSRFQGVGNIVRFNWHFYVLAIFVLVGLIMAHHWLPPGWQSWIVIGASLAAFSLLFSLVVSFYVYDCAGLYQLDWLELPPGTQLLSVNAGFDETSDLLEDTFPDVQLTVADFYDPARHTEVSVRRAREAYPPWPHTVSIETKALPFAEDSFDQVLAFLSAHEIRDQAEREQFFRELRRVCKPGGRIIVVEHLRDWANFLVYTIGAFHFHSRQEWLRTFAAAGWRLMAEHRSTPLITTFILAADGDTP
jgi:SAM-dependent methyltransferase